MKVLILSDSHQHIAFMQSCVETEKPDVILHLGDYYGDGEKLHELFPEIPMYQVPGNCDENRCSEYVSCILVPQIGGVRIYMTHGHLHHVKLQRFSLIRAASQTGAQAVLYGHTHEPECRQLSDGMWIMNPGTCGYFHSSAGIMEIQDGKIADMRIIR